MIDWLTIYYPYEHNDSYDSGTILSIDTEGEPVWVTQKRKPVEGSFGDSVQVKSTSRPTEHYSRTKFSHLEISGNPSKFLQGHNVFGTDDICSLTHDFVKLILKTLKIKQSFLTTLVSTLSSHITRVDINYSYHLANAQQVQTWLYSAELSATLKHRGKGQMNKGTLYFGKRSRRWSLKMYHKGQEILDNKKHQNVTHKILTDYANKSLRCELTLRSLELKSLNLRTLCNWRNQDISALYASYLSKLELNDNMKTLKKTELDKLSTTLKASYVLWQNGHDLKSEYSENTYYRHKRELKKLLNIDISVRQIKENIITNVVPLLQILEATPAPVPSDAFENNLYYEPDSIDDIKFIDPMITAEAG